MATVPNIGSISKPLNVCEALAWEGRRRKVGVEEGERATQAQSVAISPRPLTPLLAAKRGAPAFIRTLLFGITAGRSNYSVTLTSAACVPVCSWCLLGVCACLAVCSYLEHCWTRSVLLASFNLPQTWQNSRFQPRQDDWKRPELELDGLHFQEVAGACVEVCTVPTGVQLSEVSKDPSWFPGPRCSVRPVSAQWALLLKREGRCSTFHLQSSGALHFTSQLQLPATPYFSCSSFSCYPCARVCVWVCARACASSLSQISLWAACTLGGFMGERRGWYPDVSCLGSWKELQCMEVHARERTALSTAWCDLQFLGRI